MYFTQCLQATNVRNPTHKIQLQNFSNFKKIQLSFFDKGCNFIIKKEVCV